MVQDYLSYAFGKPAIYKAANTIIGKSSIAINNTILYSMLELTFVIKNEQNIPMCISDNNSSIHELSESIKSANCCTSGGKSKNFIY